MDGTHNEQKKIGCRDSFMTDGGQLNVNDPHQLLVWGSGKIALADTGQARILVLSLSLPRGGALRCRRVKQGCC